MIIGKLIKLTAIERYNLETILEWRNDPSVYETLFEHDLISLEHQEKWFNSILTSNDKKVYLIKTIKDNKAIGTVGLYQIDWRSRNAEWGFYIGDLNYRMGGYAAEAELKILEYAFEHLNMHRVWCQTFSSNIKVLSMHERFNFQKEGVLREKAYKNGKYEDVVIMSMLKDEFKYNKEKIQKMFDRMI